MPRREPASSGREPIPREVRPLPRFPNLEYERKQAKALLRKIRSGDPDALRRFTATHPAALRGRSAEELKLSDTQHLIAREYGFPSWPRLVEYLGELERHRDSPRYNSPDMELEWYEWRAQRIIRDHSRGDPMIARELSHFVPRFYGRPSAEVLASPITEEEARLVVARENRRTSWDELVELSVEARALMRQNVWQRADAPMGRARETVRDQDLEGLAALLDEHPELLTPSQLEREWRRSLAGLALTFERLNNTPAARRITDFVASRGVDIQTALNERLLGWPQDHSKPEIVRWHLDRGADPDWMPPNGISVIEHAIVRYRNGECVDLIAARVTPPRSLWVAAGLGDVAGVRRFIQGKGKLTAEGRLNRPDLMAMGADHGAALPPNLEADDLEIMWEAFRIAGWNGRWEAMDALLEAGLPVDHAPQGTPLALESIGGMGHSGVALLEYLVSRGADLDREWSALQGGSVRSYARSMVEHVHTPRTDTTLRILEICEAGTVEEILAEREAKRPSPPPLDERVVRVMQFAADDAARQGQAAVATENLLIGLLRGHNSAFGEALLLLGTDMRKLHAKIAQRLLPEGDPLLGQELPLDPLAEAAVRTARAEADARHRAATEPLHLLVGILEQENGPGARLLAEVGPTRGAGWEKLKAYL